MGIRQWKLPETDREKTVKLAAETALPELLCRILASRGLEDKEAVTRFLGEGSALRDPFCLKDMDKAVARIQEAVDNGERICVFGDYDCDGVTATALLVSYLQAVGADVIYYVPSREKEGYGMNVSAIEMLADQKVDLIVTVDNGVSAHGEIARAGELGMDVVVTDHHTPRDTLPDAVAVVNPHRADCESGLRELAGVGVAFKLICALEGDDGDSLLEHYSDLVTLGTIADVVPLVGENRIIVRHGLGQITNTENPGLAALLAVSGMGEKELTSEAAAFGVIPRINAAGRIGVADDVIELLLTDDPDLAAEAAAVVGEQNTKRKAIEAEILAEIEEMLASSPEIRNQRILIVSGRDWHHGVVGIVSAKLVERYDKPCIIFSLDGEEARGSGRSVKDFSLIEAITACASRLTRYGGHTQAAGLTVPVQYLEEFSQQIQAFAKERYSIMPISELCADCTLDQRDLTVENMGNLSLLEPFGAGNEAPLFHISGLRIEGIYPTTGGKHMRIRFAGAGGSFYAVYFGMTEALFSHKPGDIVEIMAKISVQEYNGKTQLSVKISDLRPQGLPQDQVLLAKDRYACFVREEALSPEEKAALLPTREEIALVYKFLRRAGTFPHDRDALYYRLMGYGIDYGRMQVALDVLAEMGFVRPAGLGCAVVPDAPKADLSRSAVLLRLAVLRPEAQLAKTETV